MSTKRTIDSFFKPKEDVNDPQLHSVREDVHNTRVQPERNGNIETPTDVEPYKHDMTDSLIRDPGLRPSILSYPSNQRDEIRRLYIKLGPYQLQKSKYPFSPSGAKVLDDIATEGSTGSQRGDATYALTHAVSFDFVIVMHIMKEIMGITDKFCQTLQQKSIDIVNALSVVSTTKVLIQKLRNEGWESLLDQVVCFCKKNDILVPDMAETYRYLQELNSRFNDHVTQLLRLSASLDPKTPFNVPDICALVTSPYPLDFTEHEKDILRLELQHYELDVHNHPHLKNYSTLSELCTGLHETGKSDTYPLFDRLIRLVPTLPISTATSERAFSAMKIVKTRL
ncbi:hypothetical protein LXL04_012690 [Taraxacum kok-saghyz]